MSVSPLSSSSPLCLCASYSITSVSNTSLLLSVSINEQLPSDSALLAVVDTPSTDAASSRLFRITSQFPTTTLLLLVPLSFPLHILHLSSPILQPSQLASLSISLSKAICLQFSSNINYFITSSTLYPYSFTPLPSFPIYHTYIIIT